MARHRPRGFAVAGTLIMASLLLGHGLIYVLVYGPGDRYARAMTEASSPRVDHNPGDRQEPGQVLPESKDRKSSVARLTTATPRPSGVVATAKALPR